jgi:hypothetical protein
MESVPDELKYLQPYLQRSQELQSREPVVAYYGKCRESLCALPVTYCRSDLIPIFTPYSKVLCCKTSFIQGTQEQKYRKVHYIFTR